MPLPKSEICLKHSEFPIFVYIKVEIQLLGMLKNASGPTVSAKKEMYSYGDNPVIKVFFCEKIDR